MTLPQGQGLRRFQAHGQALVLVIAALAQLAFLLWAARVAVPQALSCDVCDTSYYNVAAAEIAKTGLLFTNPYDGYRSYFVPFFIAAVQGLAAATGFNGGTAQLYAYGASFAFWLVSAGLMSWLAARADVPDLLRSAAPTLLNPFLIVYVPFMLQEGVLMACCLPLLFVWIAASTFQPGTRAVLVFLMALLAYIIRSSLVWWLLPAAMYAGWLLWPHVRQPRRWVPATAVVLLAGGLLLGPQVYVSKQKADSFNPYPNTALFSKQVALGISLLKYATVEDGGHWRGLVFWSPFAAEPEEIKDLRFYVDHPSRGAFLAVAHAYAGFHYDQVLPYWRVERARPLTLWLVLSSAIVFLGVTRMAHLAVTRRLDADGAFMIATLALCVASLVFLAVESRFGIVGFAMLSIASAAWFPRQPSGRPWKLAVPALFMYLALSFLYNMLLLQSADVLL